MVGEDAYADVPILAANADGAYQDLPGDESDNEEDDDFDL
jgi:hypothetical protein